MSGVGILGIGTYLPPEVRRNDWWPADVVAGWASQQARGLEALRHAPPPAQPGAQRVVRAMLELGVDPFDGIVERRVLAADMTSTDMEAAAGRAALEQAGVGPDGIDLLLVHTAVPEYLLSNTACILHHRLGLPAACLALEAQASAYAFLAQLALAVPMIETGRARYALLVQSSAASRLMDPANMFSARVGDAATAVVLGPVADGYGVLAAAHHADGRSSETLVASAPEGRWYDGRPRLRAVDLDGARRIFLDTVDQSKVVVDRVMASAGCRPDDVDFFAVHQGTPWLRRLVQEHSGLAQARSLDLFARVAYVFAASIPLVLDAAAQAGALAAGDLVVTLGGGTGMTCGASVLRWGRGSS